MIDHVLGGKPTDLGGFDVGRVLPGEAKRMVGPFVLFDHAGPTVLSPGQGVDTRPHPHIGLSTLTYLFAGEIVHRDNLGHTKEVRDGDVAWMTAGRGIVHSERTGAARRAAGGPVHGLQAWVALPEAREDDAPSFEHHEARTLPTFEDDAASGRLMAGTAFGARAPCRVHSPLFYVHWELRLGARSKLPDEHEERALFVVRGSIEVAGRQFGSGRLVVFTPRCSAVFTASTAATVVALGGSPLGERFLWWNLVSSRRERIEQAKADWAAGRMTLPPGDDREWIPLPE